MSASGRGARREEADASAWGPTVQPSATECKRNGRFSLNVDGFHCRTLSELYSTQT
jgi:hypothetical protein